jgi:hypothetical protein
MKTNDSIATNGTLVPAMGNGEKARAVELIRLIQFDGGCLEDFRVLERVTGNPDVWVIFEALELEGFLPEKIFDLLCGNNEINNDNASLMASCA